jgi:hypothetical protein
MSFKHCAKCMLSDRTLRIVLLIPGAYSTPTAETAVKFELRESDTLNETGMLFSTTTMSS